MPKRREQNSVVCSGKSEADVTIIEDCYRHSVLLKLTTDRHEASRIHSATAELLVIVEYFSVFDPMYRNTLQQFGEIVNLSL